MRVSFRPAVKVLVFIVVVLVAASCLALTQQPIQVPDLSGLDVRLAQIDNTLRQLRSDVEAIRRGSWIRDWMPLIATMITAAVAIVSLLANLRMSLRTLREKAREEERKAIREKIDEFYGPFILLRAKSKALYEELFLPRRTEDERQRYSGPDKKYRTVLALVRGHAFGDADKALLAEITQIGKQTATLIQTKMGLVDEEELQQVLSKATVHFWIIEQLMQGKFAGDEEFARFVFPSDLDRKVASKLTTLNSRLLELQR